MHCFWFLITYVNKLFYEISFNCFAFSSQTDLLVIIFPLFHVPNHLICALFTRFNNHCNETYLWCNIIVCNTTLDSVETVWTSLPRDSDNSTRIYEIILTRGDQIIFTCKYFLTWSSSLWYCRCVRLEIKLRVVVVEILHLHGDGGAGAELPLRLLLGGDHDQQELSLVWILKVKFLKK